MKLLVNDLFWRLSTSLHSVTSYVHTLHFEDCKKLFHSGILKQNFGGRRKCTLNNYDQEKPSD